MESFELTRGRITALIAGGPVLLAAIAYTAFTTIGLLAHTTEHHSASYAWQGAVIDVRSGGGNVTVREGDGASVNVAYTEHYGLRKPTVRTSRTASGLSLQAACPGGLFGNNCSVDYTLTVPRGAALELNTGDGSIRLDGVSGIVSAHTGDGSITGTNLRAGRLQAQSGDGSIRLQWATMPRTVTTTSGDGGVTLLVPPGSGQYAISTRTGQGGVHVDVNSDPKAASTLALRTGDGGISVSYG